MSKSFKILTEQYMYLLGEQKNRVWFFVCIFLLISILDLLSIGGVIPFISSISDEDFDKSQFFLILVEYTGFHDKYSIVVVLGVSIVSLFLIKAFCSYKIQYALIKFGFLHHAEVIGKLVKAYQQMSYSQYLSAHSSKLINTVSMYTNIYINQILIASLKLSAEVIISSVIFVLLLSVDYQATLLMMSLLGGVVAFHYFYIRNQLVRAGKRNSVAIEKIIKEVSQGIQGFKEIRVMGKESYFLNIVDTFSHQYASSGAQYNALMIIPRFLLELSAIIFIVSMGIISFYLYGGLTEKLPILGMFGVAAIRLMPSFNSIIGSLSSIRHATYAMNEVYVALKNSEKERSVKPSPEVIEKLEFKRLDVQAIHYKYPTSKSDIISGISLSINHGQSVAIIGKSGSGKTTLIDLLIGLLKPQSGSIKVNGKDINDTLSEWQKCIAYIPQDVFLTEDSIRRNIALGIEDHEIDEARLVQSVEMAQLSSFVEQQPDGLNSAIGERGINLSGGQRQRLALARAFYQDCQVIVMDEGTSALDSETEQRVVDAVKSLGAKCTLIIIAHRLTTIEHCDVVYEIVNGKIDKAGTYSDVTALNDR